jgi:hypothetical protein
MQQRRFNQSKTLEERLAEKHASRPARTRLNRSFTSTQTISARSSRSYASPPIKVGHLSRRSNSSEHTPQTTEYWELIRKIQPADPPC